ncbi:unnamed protein product [Musa acuminata subsp. burmannicoides]
MGAAGELRVKGGRRTRWMQHTTHKRKMEKSEVSATRRERERERG